MKLTLVINNACQYHPLHLGPNEKYAVILTKLINEQTQLVLISYTEFHPIGK